MCHNYHCIENNNTKEILLKIIIKYKILENKKTVNRERVINHIRHKTNT